MVRNNTLGAGDGFLAYQGIGNDAHVYEGDTWWGKAFYYFTRDFNYFSKDYKRLNSIRAGLHIEVFEQSAPPAPQQPQQTGPDRMW